ncbi:hypothetical protein M8J77_023440 [Diaphorina citri]|nr:hypothetical protein M8J77_023440 [Diaphorina citri]
MHIILFKLLIRTPNVAYSTLKASLRFNAEALTSALAKEKSFKQLEFCPSGHWTPNEQKRVTLHVSQTVAQGSANWGHGAHLERSTNRFEKSEFTCQHL